MDRFVVIPVSVSLMSLAAIGLWTPYSNVRVDPAIYVNFGILEICMLALYCFSRFAAHRARDDRSIFGRAFVATFASIGHLTLMLALAMPAMLFAGSLTLFTTAAGGPLVDADLAAADQALGFDWLGFLAWSNAIPLVPKVLQFAYHSVFWQVLILPFILLVTSQSKRMIEVTALVAVSAALTLVVSAVVPAIGPYAYYHPDMQLFSHYDRIIGAWHREAFDALRSGELFVLKAGVGLVSFPSFHTVLAVLFTFMMRNTPYVRVPVAVVNSLMIVSTLPVGCHYLVDVIAGAAVAAVSIYFVCYFRVAMPATAVVTA